MSLENTLSALAALSIEPKGSLVHAAACDPASWKAALDGASASTKAAVPSSYNLTKTLIFKPKTAKTATPVPIVVIASDETDTKNSTALGKRVNQKELRLAGDDLIREFFALDKDSLSPLSISADIFSKVITVLDSAISSSSEVFAVRASASEATVFLHGTDISKYLSTLETADTKVQVIDFAALKAEPIGAAPAKSTPNKKQEAKIEDAHQLAIGVKKEVDFATWYTNVLVKSEMLDYYNVSGCYILKPWSYSIWQSIQAWFDAKIKDLGVENCYFPMFVSNSVLEREKNHIEGFAPEVAWVTKAGSSDLEEPIAIRPTSETAMYPYYAKWIQSYRDLPLKLNQWNSVVRWEFKTPQPFIRTREFLWQEGHTAFLTKEEADTEVRQILDLYRRVFEDLLAVPVIPGIKSENEKFAGGLYTTTVEGFIPTTGRGIQGATSHCLGQNFSKMFGIEVEDPNDRGNKLFAWQNSWGLSTRVIGVMVMVHGDNQGLVLPPRIAHVQVVVVPCGVNEGNQTKIYDACEQLVTDLKKGGIKAKADLRDTYLPGWKFNYWEQKGVPIRLELGPKDIEKGHTVAVRRDTGAKTTFVLGGVATKVADLLEVIQNDMYNKAKTTFEERLVQVTKWEDVVTTLDNKCIVVLPWCEVGDCEDDIKARSKSTEQTDERAPSAGAKSLAIPFDQARWDPIVPGQTKCPACGMDAKRWTMFGRSY